MIEGMNQRFLTLAEVAETLNITLSAARSLVSYQPFNWEESACGVLKNPSSKNLSKPNTSIHVHA